MKFWRISVWKKSDFRQATDPPLEGWDFRSSLLCQKKTTRKWWTKGAWGFAIKDLICHPSSFLEGLDAQTLEVVVNYL